MSTPTTCPEGSYCPENTKYSTEFLCPPGSYSNQTGLSTISQCTPCNPGRYCAGEGKSYLYCIYIAKLLYQFLLASAVCEIPLVFLNHISTQYLIYILLIQNLVSITGETNHHLSNCLVMYFNQTLITSSGNTAPSGLCSPGHFCTQGAKNSTPTDGATGDVCSAGRFCVSGSVVGEGCPVGTFSNRAGLTSSADCDKCTPGTYCGQTGLIVESGICWAG